MAELVKPQKCVESKLLLTIVKTLKVRQTKGANSFGGLNNVDPNFSVYFA